jgi:hypothetical protein
MPPVRNELENGEEAMKTRLVYFSIILAMLGLLTNGGILPGSTQGKGFAPNGLSQAPDWQASLGAGEMEFGKSIAIGNLNGDAYQDVIVGTPWYPNPSTGGYGRVYVYLGTAAGPSTSPSWIIENETTSDAGIGENVAVADLNNDGRDDILATALWYSNGQSSEGALFAWLSPANWSGRPTGSLANANSLFECNVVDCQLGSGLFTLANAGDTNGDGYEDVIVGAPNYSNGLTKQGAVWVLPGTAGGFGTTPLFSYASGIPYSQFGSAVSGVGKLNNDNFDDVAVGSSWFNNMDGQVNVFYGSPSGPTSSGAWVRGGSGYNHGEFGYSVGSAGDLNKDGYNELFVGEPRYANFPVYGKAWIFYSGASGLSPNPTWTQFNFQTVRNGSIGTAVAAGDFNGDSWPDLAVGNSDYDDGLVYVFYGSVAGLAKTPSWESFSALPKSYYGRTIASGDLNGDNYSDLVISDFDYDNLNARVLAFFGGPDSAVAGLQAQNNGPAQINSPVIFTATISTGSGVQYTWDFGDGTSGIGQVAGHNYTLPGLFTAMVTATTPTNSLQASTVVNIYQDSYLFPDSTVQSADGLISVTAPADLPLPIHLHYIPENTLTNPLGAKLKFAGIVFNLSALDYEYNPLLVPDKPLSMTVNYDPAKFPTGLVEDKLAIYRFDTTSNAWVAFQVISRDMANNKLVVNLDHFCEYALMETTGNYVYLPVLKK